VYKANFWRPREGILYHGGLYQAHAPCLLLHRHSFSLLLPCVRVVWHLHTAIMIVRTMRFPNSHTYSVTQILGSTRKTQRTTTSQSVMAFLVPSTSERDLMGIHGWRGREAEAELSIDQWTVSFWKEEQT